MALFGTAWLVFLLLMVMGANRRELLAHCRFLQMPQHICERMPTESTVRAIFGTWAPGSSGGDSTEVPVLTTPPTAFWKAGTPVPQAWAGSKFPEHQPSASLPVPQTSAGWPTGCEDVPVPPNKLPERKPLARLPVPQTPAGWPAGCGDVPVPPRPAWQPAECKAAPMPQGHDSKPVVTSYNKSVASAMSTAVAPSTSPNLASVHGVTGSVAPPGVESTR